MNTRDMMATYVIENLKRRRHAACALNDRVVNEVLDTIETWLTAHPNPSIEEISDQCADMVRDYQEA